MAYSMTAATSTVKTQDMLSLALTHITDNAFSFDRSAHLTPHIFVTTDASDIGCSGAGSTGSTPVATPSPHQKPVKKIRSGQTELLRCKRRLDFNQNENSSLNLNLNFGGVGKSQPPATVARRNERERNRVRLINMTFATLRQHLPGMKSSGQQKNKKMSKVDTLKSAIDYIKQLQQMLDENDAVNAAFGNSIITNATLSPLYASAMSSSSALSPGASSATSHDSGSASETEIFHPEDEDLLDFASWFQ
ncbi:achaete-scute homolog 1-like [Lineus longissimus]|uniref:achaete-scute homolog 1-like n=1 Tax=Lineus longissimus TaxID=88925 RepID=UPI00315D80CA